MIAIIDSIFSPLLTWLDQIQEVLTGMPIVQGYNLPFSNLLAPIAMISPAWQLLITNIFVMAFLYVTMLIVINWTAMIEFFKNNVKWW